MPSLATGTLTGKGRGQTLRQGIETSLENLGKMQLAPETTAAYEQAQLAAKQGLDPYTRQQMLSQLAMANQGMLGLYGAGRLGLAKASDVARSIRSGLMQFGSQAAQARRANLGLGIQTGLGVGQQRLGLEQYKTQGLYNYLTGRLRERRETLSNLIGGAAQVGSTIGAAAIKAAVV